MAAMGTSPLLSPKVFVPVGDFFKETRMKALTDTFTRERPNERS